MAEEAPTEEIEASADDAAEKKEPKRSKSTAFMLRADVIEHTTLSKSVLRRLMMRDEFPRPVKLAPNRVAWVRSEVEAWVDAKKLERVAEAA
ncbi:helix-turn-helix transcriptional regulator [Sphingopyxis sp. P8]|uniref:helix-turn-helix transcriptional regulator n=1 Tax=Sphingopyxis sp. P8 TaxID=2763256 RepID=UPI001D0A6AA1|nr:AlpA family phage regulatory protein [Sphingopyxis sp. P8]